MLKKLLCGALAAACVMSMAACAKKPVDDPTLTDPPGDDISDASVGNVPPATDESAKPLEPATYEQTVITQATPGKVLKGKDTGNPNTYTGYDPLPEVTFAVDDPQNTKGLPTKKIAHSYGVAKDGKANQTSVDNQKFYEKYGGFTLDTSGEKTIYLTFDCGYENGYTSKILDVLKEKQTPAAFFVTQPYVEENPGLVARMIKEGHIVGNHSNKHPDFSTISRERMAKEIQDVDNLLRTKFGYSAPYFRFPEGACTESALQLVQSIGFECVFWSSAYADWDTKVQKGADYAFNTVTARLHPGCVQLLHAVSKDNTEALGRIVDHAREQGYTFCSL